MAAHVVAVNKVFAGSSDHGLQLAKSHSLKSDLIFQPFLNGFFFPCTIACATSRGSEGDLLSEKIRHGSVHVKTLKNTPWERARENPLYKASARSAGLF
jgi:hypothetical protein